MEQNKNSFSTVAIDFIKAVQNDLALSRQIRKNKLLDFHTDFNESTGEVRNFSEAEIKGLTIRVYTSGRIEIKGSLHKYWNNGVHNCNDFGINDTKEAIERLARELGVDLNKLRLHNIEIGLNLRHPFKTNDILNNLVAYGNKPFNDVKTNTPGLYRVIEKTQYSFKAYNKRLQIENDKTIQVKIDHELLRLEAHIKKNGVLVS